MDAQSQSQVPVPSVEIKTDAITEGVEKAFGKYLLKLGHTGCKLDMPQMLIVEGFRRSMNDWLAVPVNRKDFLAAISNQRTG